MFVEQITVHPMSLANSLTVGERDRASVQFSRETLLQGESGYLRRAS